MNQTAQVILKFVGDASSAISAVQTVQRALGTAGSALGTLGTHTQSLGQQFTKLGTPAKGLASVLDQTFRVAQQAASSLFKEIGHLQERLDAFGRRASITGGVLTATVTTPIVGVATAAIKAAGDFEQSMNLLAQNSGAGEQAMASLKAQALDLGAKTSFSAGEAAAAMLELSKSGFDASQIMSAVPGVLDLAAAGNLDLAKAAEIASNAVNTFQLPASKSADIANLLANAANASSIEVGDAADAFKMAGAVFSAFQGSVVGPEQAVTDLTTAIALLGNMGIKGSDAGTSLKQALLQLTGPSGVAKNAMQALYAVAQGAVTTEDELSKAIGGTKKQRQEALAAIQANNEGLQLEGDIAYDASGKMRPLREIIDLVAKATKNMSDEQRNQALTTIFGADATRSIIALLQSGEQGWDDMAAAVTKAGGAQDLANARMKGIAGAVEYFKGSVDSFLIATALPFLDSLSSLVIGAADLLSAFSALPAPVKNATLAFVAGLAATGPLILTLGALASALAFVLTPFGLAVAAMGVFTTTASVLAVQNADTLVPALKALGTTLLALGQYFRFVATDGDVLNDYLTHLPPAIRPAVHAIAEFGVRLQDAGRSFADTFTPERRAILQRLVEDLLGVASETSIVANAFRLLGTYLPSLIVALGDFVGLLIDGIGSLQQTGHQADVLRVALIGIGTWIGLNKLADLVTGLQGTEQAAKGVEKAAQSTWDTLTRGPKLVTTTITTVWGKTEDARIWAQLYGEHYANAAGRTVQRTIQTAFATADDAARWAQLHAAQTARSVLTTLKTAWASTEDARLWAQLYGETAVPTIKKTISTAWDAIPPPPALPNLSAPITSLWEKLPSPPALPKFDVPITTNFSPQAIADQGKEIGGKIASSLASGLASAVGGMIAASGTAASLATSLGGAFTAALPVILPVVAVVAAAAALYFATRWVADIVEQHGGFANAMRDLFLVAIPRGIGAAAAAIVNGAAQVALWLLEGVGNAGPMIADFIGQNWPALLIAAVRLVFGPIPAIALSILTAIGPELQRLGAELGTIVSTTWGSITERVRRAVDEIATVGAQTWTDITATARRAGIDLVVAVVSMWTDIVARVRQTASELWSVVMDTWDRVVAIVVQTGQRMWMAVEDAFAPLGSLIRNIMAHNWGQAVRDGLQLVYNVFLALPGKLVAIVGDAFGQVVSVLGDAGRRMWDAVSRAWADITIRVADAGREIWQIVSSAWTDVTGRVAQAGRDIWQSLHQAWTDVTTSLRSAWSEISSAIGQFLSDIWQKAVRFKDDVVATLQGGWDAMLGGAKTFLQNLLGSFAQNLDIDLLNRVRETWRKLVGETGEALGRFVQLGKEKAEELRDRISEGVGRVGEILLTPFRTARDGLGSVLQGIKDAILRPLDSALDGISSFVNKFKSAINSISNALTDKPIITFPDLALSIPGYAKGTPNDRHAHPGGPAFVDDGRGALAGNELILDAKRGPFMFRDRGTKLIDLAPGSSVISAPQTKRLLNHLRTFGTDAPGLPDLVNRIPRYAEGTSSIDAIWDWFGQGTDYLLEKALGGLGLALPGVLDSLASGIVAKVIGLAKQWLESDGVAGGAPYVGGGIRAAMQAMGLGAAAITGRFYDSRGSLGMHMGTDFATTAGTVIRALFGGRVQQDFFDSIGGNLITIQSGSGQRAYYGHRQNATGLTGRTVATGQPIGTVGQTGYATGPHVHFMITAANGGPWVDPERLFGTGGGGGGQYTALANGGWITEPIIGTGMRSLTKWMLGENEPEFVIPFRKLQEWMQAFVEPLRGAGERAPDPLSLGGMLPELRTLGTIDPAQLMQRRAAMTLPAPREYAHALADRVQARLHPAPRPIEVNFHGDMNIGNDLTRWEVQGMMREVVIDALEQLARGQNVRDLLG